MAERRLVVRAGPERADAANADRLVALLATGLARMLAHETQGPDEDAAVVDFAADLRIHTTDQKSGV